MEPIVPKELDKETLERLYLQERMSLRSIAKLCGRSYLFVRYRKEKYGIPTIKPYYKKKEIPQKILFKWIVEEGKTLKVVAEQLSCAAITVRKRCDEYGILPRHERLKKITKAKIQKLYVAEGNSMRKVAKELECSYETIRNRCKKYGIPIQNHQGRKIDIPKASLQRLYLKEGKTLACIAKEFGCSIGTISSRLQKFKLNRYLKC